MEASASDESPASDHRPEDTSGAPAVLDLGAVFQAPATPRRRRASSPSASPTASPAASPTASPTASPAAPSAGSTRRSRRATSTGNADPSAQVGQVAPDVPAVLAEDIPAEAEQPELLADELAVDVAVRDTDATDTDAMDTDATDTESDDTSDAPRRRRRRGGKGRRGRGSASSEAADAPADTPTVSSTSSTSSTTTTDDQAAEAKTSTGAAPASDDTSSEASEDGAGDEASDGSPSSRRRTRRRRRSSGGGEQDDTPGVTTRVREPREREPRDSRRDEVTALKGSTRLEAKKQRRREGRDAGRRRTVITEAEFLARRESVERVMVVRHLGDRTQIGVLEDGVLVEHYISKETSVSMAGNIYLGRVQNVLPSMEAAFVDIGKGRNAVLYAGEVNWDAAGLENNQAKRIENALSSGESVLVQVTKDPIGHKGARLTSQISLPGRYLVYVPNSSMTGISRKLPDTERARLKKILKEVVPSTAGVIVRTAAEGASEAELRADVERLTHTWDEIMATAEAAGGSGKKAKKSGSAPVLLHGEPDLTVRVIRDIFNEDFASLVVAGELAWQEVSEYVGSVAPDLAERVTRWTSEEDLFTRYRVDEQIAKAMDRKVFLPSGGSLVIDRTEAMTVVDVNTGKFIGSGGNLEETVTKNNIEAAEEIVRQLRLRDVGGIIVIDFIDMVLESNRDLVVRRMLECLGRDRTKHQVAEVTSLGLVQMTRKRVGSGLIEVFSETCEHCAGRGFIISSDPVDKSDGNGMGSHEHSGSGSGGASNASNAGNAGNAGNGGHTGSRGGQSARGRATEPAAAHRPQGPTPAQIAAAAHAAAMKTAELAVSEVLADAGMPDIPGTDLSEALDALDPITADVVDVELDLSEVAVFEQTAEPEPVRAAYPPPVATPVGAPRRRRGRVVAPAGPPRAAGRDEEAPVSDG
ncbi:MAG: Rne/Rng family ribonuclease [Actinomycetota bacterium]|nr:Rne/Rng family ribonuclease [Actinomycetota bacterium]